jgi:sarcosine oxidase
VRRDFHYAVIGLGGIGSAAAYWLARRAGEDVLGLEQFQIGHDRGASQDHSRIIRLAYHTPQYVALAKAAYRAWAALEQDLGSRLIFTTGGLDLAPRGGPIPLADYAESLRTNGVAFEKFDGTELRNRWPQFSVPAHLDCLFQPDAGILAAARCNAAHARLARARGATLREHERVDHVRASGGEFELVASEGNYRCARLIVTADAWTNRVLSDFDLRLPLTVTQEQVTYFASKAPGDFALERFPVWIWNDDPCFYGLPAYGEAGPKVGQDVGGAEVSPDARSFNSDMRTLQRVSEFLAAYLPSALGPVIRTKTCLYTLTPDRDFVIDAVPGYPDVFVALGASHGFKFASILGKLLSDLVSERSTEQDTSPFKFDRPALATDNPRTRFLI